MLRRIRCAAYHPSRAGVNGSTLPFATNLVVPVQSMRRLLLLGALSALPALYSREAAGTVMVERSLDELARQADLIVVATPSAARRSFWQHGRIYTDVSLTVNLVVQGAAPAGEALRVRLPGGTVGDIGQMLAGAPALDPGNVYLLFLTAPRDGARAVLNLAAGSLPVTVGASGEVRVMPARTGGLTFVPPLGGSSSVQRFEIPPEGERLERVVARLRAVVR